MKLYDVLRESNLLRRGKIQASRVENLSASQILDLAERLRISSQPEPRTGKLSYFEHAASTSLGGGRDECMAITCRWERLGHLARFAALYSDRVHIRSFFADYEHAKAKKINISALRSVFAEDLILLVALKPLLESQLIVFEGDLRHICLDCFAAAIGHGDHAGSVVKSAFAQLRNEYRENTEFLLTRKNNLYFLSISGPEPYFNHAFYQVWKSLPQLIEARPRILQQLQNTGSVIISPTLASQLRLYDDLTGKVGMNLAYALLAAYSRKTSFLTDKEIHIRFLQTLGTSVDEERTNKIALEHLTTIVPFLEDLRLSDLVRLRKKEEESFTQFRAALNRSIYDFAKLGKSLTRVEARQIYADIIAPELARLEKTVKQARRSLFKNVGISAVGMIGAISFGLLSGLVSPEFTAIAQAIGLTKFSGDAISNLASIKNAEDSIRHDNYYFLWKAQHLSQ
jgi:hypothetical protein